MAMAASVTTSRAIYAGLSCGVAFAVPVCAYAVTLPFPAANGIVATCALPFTVGALAGVGLVTAMGAVAAARAAGKPAPMRKFCEEELASEPVLMDGTDLMKLLFDPDFRG